MQLWGVFIHIPKSGDPTFQLDFVERPEYLSPEDFVRKLQSPLLDKVAAVRYSDATKMDEKDIQAILLGHKTLSSGVHIEWERRTTPPKRYKDDSMLRTLRQHFQDLRNCWETQPEKDSVAGEE